MKKTILIAFVFASLMLFTPFTTIAQENKMSSNLTDSPDIDGLVAQIRTVVNEVLEKYGHIPMVRGLCNVILNSLGLIGKIIFCISILIIEIPLTILWVILSFMRLQPFYLMLLVVGLAVFYDDYCPPTNPYKSLLSPFQSPYTFLETKDTTNLAKDCPCLQE